MSEQSLISASHYRTMPTVLSGWAKNLILLFFASAMTLLLIEIVVRAGAQLFIDSSVRSDRPKYYYKPDNSAAFHDFRYSKIKASNVFRIAVVGDSFSYPLYLQFDDAYSKRLERMLSLNEADSSSVRAEVINYGRAGASTLYEVGIVKKGLKGGADLVLLQITLNDPELYTYHQTMKRNPEKYSFEIPWMDESAYPLLHHWKTLQLVGRRIRNHRSFDSYERYHRDLFSDSETWGYFSSSIRKIAQLTKEANTPIAAVVFPFLNMPLDENYPFLAEHRKITQLLSEVGIKHIDLFGAFEGIPSERLVVMPNKDGHPNEIAHRIAGEEIYKMLELNDLIPESLIVRDKYLARGRLMHNRVDFRKAREAE